MNKEDFFYNGIDLRKANVFELTTNDDFLSQFYSPDLGIKNKEDFLSLGKETNISRISGLYLFAEHFNVKPLIEKLNNIYKNELSKFFNE